MSRGLPTCILCEKEVVFAERVGVHGEGRSGGTIWAHQRCATRLAAVLLQAVNGDDATSPVSERATLSTASLYRAGLTSRELQALRCMANGYTNRQIAGELGITLKTARNLVSAVLSKLDAVNRAEAVAIAGREGLLS